ncbi:MAG: peptidoglycan-binding protein [Ruminococcus sp.]|nr:peptidoglycan-binding protein [Ruminococcus sp.]
MKNKFISLTLAFAMAVSSALAFSGCGDENYPVKVGNFTIDKQPEKIVVLDPTTADILSYLGYDVKMVGRSDDVDQSWMSVVPSMGEASNPDVTKIKESGAEYVFADNTLSENIQKDLEDSNITIITMSQAKTDAQLETNYVTLGKIFGGAITGSNTGGNAYKQLKSELEDIKEAVTTSKKTDVLDTVCYIYTDGEKLNLISGGTYGDMMLKYTDAVNVAGLSSEEDEMNVTQLKIANPNYIFYADEQTYDLIKKDKTLSSLTAVKKKKTLMITEEELNRQGKTAVDTLKKMVDFMYPGIIKTNESNNNNKNETQPTTVADTSVAKDYKIEITDKLTLKKEDENKNVKAVQKRLFDLGYVTDEGNITGYYGEITEQAVKDFQKNNGLEQSGKATNETIVALFETDAVKAEKE